MIRVLSRAALPIVLLTGLAGCAVLPGGGQPSPTADPSEGAPMTETVVDDRCDGVVPDEGYAGVWDGGLVLEPLFPFGAAATWGMEGTALVQSEALICTWSRDGVPAALVLAMGGGEPGFRRSEAVFADASGPYEAVPILDGAFVACRGDDVVSCHWNVLSGPDWISVLLIDVPVDDLLVPDLAASAQAGLVTTIGASVAAREIPPTSPVSPATDCTARLTPEALAEPLGVDAARISIVPSPPLEEASLEASSPQTGQVMWKYAYELLGYSNCGIQVDGNLVGVAFVATGSAWVLQDAGAEQPELVEVGDHGDGIEECSPQGSSTSCTVAFAAGEDLYFAQFGVPTELDGAAIARATLELLLD